MNPSKPPRKQQKLSEMFKSSSSETAAERSAQKFELSHMDDVDQSSEKEEHLADPYDLSSVNLECLSMATAPPAQRQRPPPMFRMPKGKVSTTPYVPIELSEPRRFVEVDNQDHLSRLRYRNMLARGLFEHDHYTLPVCSNGRLW